MDILIAVGVAVGIFFVMGVGNATLAVHWRMIILRERLVKLEEANQTGYHDRQEAEELLEGRQAQDQRQKQQKLQLEQLQNDQHRDQELLQLMTSFEKENMNYSSAEIDG